MKMIVAFEKAYKQEEIGMKFEFTTPGIPQQNNCRLMG